MVPVSHLGTLFSVVLCLFSHRTQNVLGEKGRRIRELTAVVQKRFGFPEGSVEVKLPQELGGALGFVMAAWCQLKGGSKIIWAIAWLQKYSCTEIQNELQRNCCGAGGSLRSKQ